LLASTIAPSAIREFGGIAFITWLTAAYLASSITAASAAGRMTARIGSRRAFIAAGIIFAAGALTCATAIDMATLIAGRFIQGAGGGLLSSLSYMLVRSSLPENLWARAFAAISGMWGIAVLLGPLIGGLFANAGSWRNAFVLVALAALALAVIAARALEPDRPEPQEGQAAFPATQLGLMCFSIAAICVAQVAARSWLKGTLILLAVGAFCLMLRQNRPTRCLLGAQRCGRGPLDGAAAVDRKRSILDLWSAVSAGATWPQSAERGLHGGPGSHLLDLGRHHRFGHSGAASIARDDRRTTDHGGRPGWHCLAYAVGYGDATAVADLPVRFRDRRLLVFHRTAGDEVSPGG
jgi:MFS family permease